MSAEVTTMDLDARRRARSVDATLCAADTLLEMTFAELGEALRQAAAGTGDGGTADPLRDLPGHDPGPLGVDLAEGATDRAGAAAGVEVHGGHLGTHRPHRLVPRPSGLDPPSAGVRSRA